MTERKRCAREIAVSPAHRWESPTGWWKGTLLVSLRVLGAERITSGQNFGSELCLHITTWMNGCVTETSPVDSNAIGQ
jgi:hypothetical protein